MSEIRAAGVTQQRTKGVRHMDCIHGLEMGCAWCKPDFDDLYGVMVVDRPIDYSGFELDEKLWVDLTLDGHTYTVSVARASGGTDNPCPSEAGFQVALEDAAWEREVECLACNTVEGDGFPYYDDHTCIVWESRPIRPRATEYPKPETVGRPAGMRVEFTGIGAGSQGVETLEPEEGLVPQELVITPLEWDEPVEQVALPHEDFVRLRWELSESRQHRLAVLALECECPHDLGDCDQAGDCPCKICHTPHGYTHPNSVAYAAYAAWEAGS